MSVFRAPYLEDAVPGHIGLELGVPRTRAVSDGATIYTEVPDCDTSINTDGGGIIFPLHPGTWGCIAPLGDIPHPDYMFRATGTTTSPLTDIANDPGKTMAAVGAGTYGNAVTSWTATALGTTETSSQGWRVPVNANGAWWDVGRQSVAALVWAAVTSVGGNRPLFCLAGASLHLRMKTGGLLGLFANNLEATGAFDYRHGGAQVVHPYLFIYNRKTSVTEVYTDKEHLTGTWFFASDNEKGYGVTGQAPPVTRQLGFDVWTGERAEKIASLGKTLLTRLNYVLPY